MNAVAKSEPAVQSTVFVQSVLTVKPFPALKTSYDVHGEVLPIYQKDVPRCPLQIPAIQACSVEIQV